MGKNYLDFILLTWHKYAKECETFHIIKNYKL